MAGSNLTLADAALKDFYLPTVREQLNNSNVLLQQIESSSKDVEGRQAILALHVRRNSGVGARLEGGTLPTAGFQKYANEKVLLKHNYATIGITGPQMRAMKSDRGSYVRAVDSEMRGAVNDIRRNVNRQVWGTSDGVIVKVGAVTAGVLIPWHTSATNVQKRQIEVGMVIDIGTASPFTSVAIGRTVVSTDPTNGITVDVAVTTANGDSVVKSGSGGSGASQSELTGVQTIIAATGSLFNIDPATEPVWASTVLSNGGTLRASTETLFAQGVQQAAIFSGEEVDMFLCSDGVHRNFAAQLLAQKRFANTITLKGGYEAISITAGGSAKALYWDRDCPSNTAYGFSTAHLMQHQQSDWTWADDDGAVLSRVVGQDAYVAFMYKDHELTCDQRNAFLKLADLSES